MMRHTCAAAWETFCAEGVGSHHQRLKAADENVEMNRTCVMYYQPILQMNLYSYFSLISIVF